MSGVARRLVCALVIGLCANLARADQALDDYNLAVQLYSQNRWSQAADTFRKFLRENALHEKAPYARLYLGLTLVNQSDFKAARDELRGFVKDSPQNQNIPQAKYRVAECSYLLNDLPAARTELVAYLKDHPQDALVERALPYLGDVQLRLNDAAAAEQTFADAVQRFPNGALVEDARFGWAKALEAQQKIDEALATYRALAKGNGARAADALFQIGARLFEQRQFADAAAEYRDLAERFPESRLAGDARLNAGFALFNADRFTEAAREFEQAAAHKGREIAAGYWRGRSLKGAGDYAAAADVLSETASRAENHPLAETILFQRGICERLAGRTEEAQTSFLKVVERFPAGELADDALHFAAELAIEAGDLDAAAARLAQFDKDFPRSGLRMHQELLAGRLALLRATKASGGDAQEHYAAAASRFDGVLQDSTKPATRAQARYYLALTRQLQGQHPQALQIIAPLIEELEKSPELADALVLQADSLLHLQQLEPAIAALERYLTSSPKGRQAARALSLSAVALTRAKNTGGAAAALDRLNKDFPTSSYRANTLLQLAELADERQDWTAAADLYRQLQRLAEGTENEIFAWRGLGFAQFQQKQFADAADTFSRITRDFATHRLASEAAYYHAESLREAGRLAEAAAAFVAAFENGAPKSAPATGDEQRPPLLFVFRAGLQAARTFKQAQQLPEADKAYAAVLDKIPKPQNLDRVLDEWALLNYEAQRYEQSDALFRRLIQETPGSDLADNARLSLAESDLLAGKLDAARTALEELQASARSDDEVKERAQFQLIVLSLQQQRWAEVRERSAKFLAAHPSSADRPYIEYCRFEAQLAEPQVPANQLEPLLKDISAALAALPHAPADWHPRLWVLQAEAQFRLKKYDDITRTLADFHLRQPKATSGYQIEEIVGRALKQQAKFPEAREAFERVLADPAAFRTETAAKAQFLIAETWLLEEKWSEAFLAYQKVYANYKFPDWQAEALLQSGKCDEQQGQWTDAARSYEQLIREFPQSPRVAEAKKRLDNARKRAALKS
jgi:TolA-binding protein